PSRTWTYSGDNAGQADFTALRAPGTYVIAVPGVGVSYPFTVGERIHEPLARLALRAYYYQRASMPLLAQFAGAWSRAEGHPDTNVIVHSSAATALRPAGTVIASPGGWYDAGDYNKYIVNSGISTYTILATYESFPLYCAHLSTNIPESGNGVPDILNEALWNIRWMLTMQDPGDGGVYHKLTNTNFDGFVMPDQATNPRYVVMKSTAATLDFAAVMAQAARVYAAFGGVLPGFADSCRDAALKAWAWARLHPAVYFNQSDMNLSFSPAINTGEYGDGYVQDERDWAAAELFVTTARDSFLAAANPLNAATAALPDWANVRTLGLYTLATYRAVVAGSVDTALLRSRLLALAGTLRTSMNNSAYAVPMGVTAGDFVWGSNAVAANQAMALLVAFRLTRDSSYFRGALANCDYLLGRNPTTYCFVTGMGSFSPLHIHHRVSQADGITDPVPGFLVGGPNPGQQDGQTTYPPGSSSLPALSYTDNYQAYACNEVAINWNAPLVYLAVGLEAMLAPDGIPTSAPRTGSGRALPGTFGLDQNYPNPFNPLTVIRYSLPSRSPVALRVFNALGQRIATLVDGEQEAGLHQVLFDGSRLPSGVYFCSMRSGAFADTKRLVLLH
ncbi:MAG TPA: glycoside hydrolase family 9 protein, partial [Bacteroidota bacterium]|nr:glycoside hydrolase family 9 protein [Bacteroidota bacterium]